MIENMNSQQFSLALVKTVLLLVFFNVLSSAILPFIIHNEIRIPISLLFALFFSLRFRHAAVPFLILFCEFIQGGFSILGW